MNPYRVLLSMFVGALLFAGPLAIETSWGQEPETPASAEETPEGETAPEAESEAPAEPEYYEKKEIDYTINTLIMFVCAVLVIFMQAGFAMVESGFNASKNTVNILAKNLMDLSVGVVLYLFIGFGLMYPGEAGAGKWFCWPGFGPFDRDSTDVVAGLGDYSGSADFLFQVAFAATAATIVSGAVAGRMKFTGYLIYSAILTGLIYPISGMWKWGEGALDAMGFQDFAGSVVVHAVGGFAGLAGAIVLGARIGRYSEDGKSQPMIGHSIPLAALGVFILLVGWYGFNPGSQLTYSGAADAEATSFIAVTTTLSAATGAIFAMGLSWILFRKPDLSMALNGMLAGLVGITANCDRVSFEEALIIGSVSGILVVLAIIALDKMKIDDPVGAFPVHGACGVWGGIATGIFGDIPIDDFPDMTRADFLMVQLKSTAIICVWAFVTMFALFFVLKKVGLLRVSAEEEIAGLDYHEHGMPAYTP